MKDKTQEMGKGYFVYPMGIVRRGREGSTVEIYKRFRPALAHLSGFSHVIVAWWADRHDNEMSRGTLQYPPPYAPDKVTDVFACRAEYRPNPIALTVCAIENVDEESGSVGIRELDALDGTPVLDLKSYFPACDRERDARLPDWLAGWPEWTPDEGIGL